MLEEKVLHEPAASSQLVGRVIELERAAHQQGWSVRLSDAVAAEAPERNETTILEPPPALLSGVRRPIAVVKDDSWDKGSERGFKLTKSIWDTAVLVGLPKLGAACSAWTVLLLLATMFAQGVFTLVVMKARACSLCMGTDVEIGTRDRTQSRTCTHTGARCA